MLTIAIAGLCGPAATAQIKVGIIGDQTGTTDLDGAYRLLAQGIATLNDYDVELILHVGDLVESTEPIPDVTARFRQAANLISAYKIPWYLTAGDHDVNPPVFKQNSTDRSRETLFKKLYGAVNPLAAQNLYYSFDMKGFHFVVLYSLEHLHTDPRWGNTFYSRISDRQFAWLQRDLAANTPGMAGTIVLLHQPMWYNWKGWSRVHALLAQYGVKTVIAGHFHYNQSQLLMDGIDYRVMGSTGGTTKGGSQNAGDLYHVSVMTLSPSGAPTFTMLPLSGFTENRWTPKPIMDRVQAMDQNLGNIFSFARNSPVFLQNGALVAECDTTTAARLVIKDIGNAAAVPVGVTIAVSTTPANAVTVTQPSFGAGLCQAVNGSYQCQLAPSAGVAVANTSLVEMSQYPPPPPLWSATVSPGTTAPTIGTKISVSVTQSFMDGGQRYWIFKTNATEIRACAN